MEQKIAEQKSKDLKIDRTQVVREYWELILLKGLYDFPVGRSLIFKGGTALRLAYDSPRFSEDLDFSLVGKLTKEGFYKQITRIISPFSELTLTDLEEKYYTFLSEIKVTQNYLPLPFRIKIEISKREKKGYSWELKLIHSPSTVIQVLVPVATLGQLYQDKLNCLKERAKPKDLFDLWYISQKMNIPYSPPAVSWKKEKIIQELRKYLPKTFWSALGELVP